jgi:hypothetical protein
MHLQGKLSVERMCQLAGVSRAGFYRHLVEIEPDEEEMQLRDAIQRIYLEHRRHYGYRRTTRVLHHRGMLVNRKRVARLMQEDNLIAISQRKYVVTTDSEHDLQVYLNLAARMEITALGGRHHLHSVARSLCFPGRDFGRIFAQGIGLVPGSELAQRTGPNGFKEGDRAATPEGRTGASLRSRSAVRQPGIHRPTRGARHNSEHESAWESLGQRQL